MIDAYGPRTDFGRLIHSMKYRAPEESYDDYAVRYARSTSESEAHFRRGLRYYRDQFILPAGRQQLAVGRPQQTTGVNCFVLGTIPDSTRGIFEALADAAMTLRAGGGVGMDFSTLRPDGEPVRGLGHGAVASGPISFMNVWNAMSGTIMSAGERRGAMMAVLRCDHPDILKFVRAKQNGTSLTNFNISVAATDAFMEAVENDGLYELRFGETSFGTARALDVWSVMMEANWDWAEPGILFIDRINRLNPLWYCECIAATNPCAEQPLPPYGACLLGSINVVKFLTTQHEVEGLTLAAQSGKQLQRYGIDYEMLDDAVDCAVRAFDNVLDRTVFPLEQQKAEALAKRRMGVGATGLADAGAVLGLAYASPEYIQWQEMVLERINTQAYRTSIELAKEKGPFPLFNAHRHLDGIFIRRLPEDIRDGIQRYGLRNGLLTSIAPTGTISMAADNISSGIEPVFAHEVQRTINTPQGPREFQITNYARNFYGVDGRTADEVTAQEHIDVLCSAQKFVDSSISKTCNVNGQIAGEGPGVSFADFKELYMRAWKGGAKSCSTFNLTGKRSGIMKAVKSDDDIDARQQRASSDVDGRACYYDSETGARSCAD